MQNKAGDGDGIVVGQVPFKLPVQVAQRRGSRNDVGSIGLPSHARHRDVVLVFDTPDDFFENILQCNDPHDRAIFVDHDCEMLAPGAEGLQLIEKRCRLGDKPRFGGELQDVELLYTVLLRVQVAQESLGVQDADDIVGIITK